MIVSDVVGNDLTVVRGGTPVAHHRPATSC